MANLESCRPIAPQEVNYTVECETDNLRESVWNG